MTLSHVDMWNIWGEKFSGMVTHHGRKKTRFRILEHETLADVWVDLDKLNYWEYCKTSDPIDCSTPSTRTPSPEASRVMEDDQE